MKKKLLALAVIMTMMISQFSLITFAADVNGLGEGSETIVTLYEAIGPLYKDVESQVVLDECHVEMENGGDEIDDDFKVTDLRFTDSKWGTVSREAVDDADCWVVTPSLSGSTTMDVTVDVNGTAIVHHEPVEIALYDTEDVFIQCDSADNLFPGDSVQLSAVADGITLPSGVKYEWSFADEDAADAAVLTPNGSKATVRIKDSLNDDDNVEVGVVLKVYSGTELLAYDSVSFSVSSYYYRLEPLEEDVRTSIQVNNSETINPQLFKVTAANRAGTLVTDATFEIHLENEEIFHNSYYGDIKYNDFAEILTNADGTYTVTRKDDGEFVVSLEAFIGGESVASAEYVFNNLDEPVVSYMFPEDETIFVLNNKTKADGSGILTIESETTGFMSTGEADEDGEFDCTITDVKKVNDSDSVTIKKYTEDDFVYWEVTSKTAGVYDIELRYTGFNGNTNQKYTFKLTVTNDIYSLEVDCKASTLLPGESATVTVTEAKHENDKGQSLNDFVIDWRVEGDLADYATITPNEDGMSAVIKFNDSIDFDSLPSDDWTVGAVAVMKVKGVEVLTADAEIALSSEYYEISPDTLENFAPGKSIAYEPKVTLHRLENGKQTTSEVENAAFSISYEEDLISVTTQQNGKKVEVYSDDDPIAGPFTIKRLEAEPIELEVTAYRLEGGELEELDGAFATYSFEEMFDISDAEIGSIKAKVYNGKSQTPSPKVVILDDDDKEVKLVKGKDYTVTYKNNRNVGKATVTFTGIGKFYGKTSRSFKILPKGTKIKSFTSSLKGFKVVWEKQATQTTGYEIQCSLKKNFKKIAKKTIVKSPGTTTAKVTKLGSKKTYYVRIRTYKEIKNGKKTSIFYSDWSKIKTVTTKK